MTFVTRASPFIRWQRGAKSNQTYLILKDGKAAGAALDKLLCQRSKLNPNPKPSHPKPQPPQPKPAGMCVLPAAASAGAGPQQKGFGGGNYTAAWDGDMHTFYDYSKPDGGFTEATLAGGAAAVAHIEFFPRADFLAREKGGKVLEELSGCV